MPVESFIPEEQEYQFWEMFPANKVEVERFKVQDKNDLSIDRIWEIQAGSFYEYDDANEVRGSLILLGLEARIEIVSIENQNRYRVILGPYNKKGDVADLERLLEENGIESITKSISLEQSQSEPQTD
ncbi:MAG: SPOR domain-containing protein [Pseudomonadota bacterium]|nr:SPOR domain-containing protein [Pseudomonadota bacterium]